MSWKRLIMPRAILGGISHLFDDIVQHCVMCRTLLAEVAHAPAEVAQAGSMIQHVWLANAEHLVPLLSSDWANSVLLYEVAAEVVYDCKSVTVLCLKAGYV